jgi:integrative and conjugative element protein (TIGR02256 family)
MIIKMDEFQVKISQDVLNSLRNYRQLEMNDIEAGGVLLGRFITDSNNVVIDRITEPMENDIRKRCFFKKWREDHQEIIDKVWTESSGTCNYLGEWHTHPEPHPTPSFHDRSEWKKILKHTVCDSDKLFFIIVGTKSIGIWVGCRTKFSITKIN